ncbi:SHOCT domain-containing protein [Streptomonospora salina]|uniref:SHOCT domain-containing protein n=1 Tax=Streptomonospora salina TaxID=104205 RepID=A0A841EFB7_9ACTN|nr:SHOCT domain-containing protein [Streptomonospora salina]MBB5999588.1 hypothetical protein [Streptomonospora salina]
MTTALTAAADAAAETVLAAGPADRFHHPPPFPPMIGAAMLLVLVLPGLLAYLWISRSTGRRPPWAPAAEPPERAARAVLAERLARGDVTVDEFLERASALNWTPGERSGGRT